MERSAPVSQILAVAFDPRLSERPKIEGLYLTVRLVNGGVLHVKSLENVAGGSSVFDVTTLLGTRVKLQASDIFDVSVRNGRVRYLSDLKPKSVMVTPFADEQSQPRFDRNVLGGPLMLASTPYTKGIGVRSRTSLSYDIGQATHFAATVGLDDSAGKAGSVRFLIYLDGKLARDIGEMDSITKPKAVELDVKGKQVIQLLVDFAQRGDVDDLANWCDARLVE
jgi:hypothetical protein